MWTLGYWIHERLEGVLFQPVATVLFWIGKQMQRHLAFHSTLYNLLPASPTASMQNNHEVIFEWPHPEATTVIVTGTFDQWSSSIHLAKDGAGFKGSAQIPWDEKIAYKFIVDGEWSIAPSQPTETDSSGNVNNIYIAPSKPLPPTTTMPEKPVDKQEAEAGGGVSQVVSDLATAGTAAGLGYVASGVGAVVQTVVGEDPEKTTTKAASEAPEPETPEPVPPVVESTPAVVVPPVVEAPPTEAAPEPEPTPPEPTSVPEPTPPEPTPVPLAVPAPLAPIVPIAIVPVNAAENNESPPPSAETKEEASTHRPSSFSSTPVVAAEVPPAPTEVSPAPVEVPPAPVEVPLAPTEAPPAPVEVSPAPAVAPISSDVIEDKKSIPETPLEKPPTNGPAAEADKPVPQPQLATPPPSAPSTPKKKEAFPSTESPSSSPASSSKFGTSGSARKKRSSIFGKINIKHMFSPSKDKDKDKK